MLKTCFIKTSKFSQTVLPRRRPPTNSKYYIGGVLASSLAIAYYSMNQFDNDTQQPKFISKVQVAQHNNLQDGVWVTFKNKVYDITEFVQVHPGGKERIMQAAGKGIDPYWKLYLVHQKQDTFDILEQFKIGELDPNESITTEEAVDDVFVNDPIRSSNLIVKSEKPCNAETSREFLKSSITPNQEFYVRNHLYVPNIDPKKFEIVVQVEQDEIRMSLDDLKKLPKSNIEATVQCAGNRRRDMDLQKPVNGLKWDIGAIGNAVWGGVKVRDVLEHQDLLNQARQYQHMQFEGAEAYGASIPMAKALDLKGDVLLAYEMNGEPIPADHGFPLRVVVPGHVGARSVKWLNKIVFSNEESRSHWQRRDYKGFSPADTGTSLDYDSSVAIQELPVTSAIITPSHLEKVKECETMQVNGYAWSGGGRKIIRVDVSSDGGSTWHKTDLIHSNNVKDNSKDWEWTHWNATVPVKNGENEILCKAVDESYNVQPETVPPIYNPRGVLNNAWHRIKIHVE